MSQHNVAASVSEWTSKADSPFVVGSGFGLCLGLMKLHSLTLAATFGNNRSLPAIHAPTVKGIT